MKSSRSLDHGPALPVTDEKEREVQTMFSSIATRYDFNNSLLSMGLHHAWKKKAAQMVQVREGMAVLDLCAGTADIAIRLAEEVKRSVPPASRNTLIFAVDLNEPMLQLGKQKIGRQGLNRAIICMRGNAEHLHFKDRCLDAVTVAFGIRNLQNIGQALAEIYRVLKPGGRLICLEFSHPSGKWLRKLYDFYSFRLLPLIGTALTGDRTGVYRYLPASIRHFPGQDVFSQIIQETGFRKVEYCNLSGGIVAIHIGVK